jgi:hypothetical protein
MPLMVIEQSVRDPLRHRFPTALTNPRVARRANSTFVQLLGGLVGYTVATWAMIMARPAQIALAKDR